MSQTEDRPKPVGETDPRFPTGPWTGFWLQQDRPGRQKMHLTLAFANGCVTGEGRDPVGDFTFRGTYDLKTGRCLLLKHYIGRHQCIYEGVNEGDGLWLWGLWRLPSDQGGFHLWPAGEDDPTLGKRKEKKKMPRGATERKQLQEAGAA